MIRIADHPSGGDGESVLVITIRSRDLAEYALLSKMGVVFFFDFTRFIPDCFLGWSNIRRFEFNEQDLFYRGGLEHGIGSFIKGRQVLLPTTTKREIIGRLKERHHPTHKRYATFKAVDLKTGKRLKVSCDPASLSNYFQPNSNLPLEMSPVFFRGGVLSKYKADPSKYELEDRSIHCRDAWYLETYDVNEVGQVHTYLRYLSSLPYKEQLYWQSFNEWPKGPLSKRAFTTDFEGEFSNEYDPVAEVRSKVERLDARRPEWWVVRGTELPATLHYPITGSEAEWSDAILTLDQLVIEGFRKTKLKKICNERNTNIDPAWGSLKLLELCLVDLSNSREDSLRAVDALRSVHNLRTAVKGHYAPNRRAEEIEKARVSHGNLNDHFRMLATNCDESLKFIIRHMCA